MQAVTIVARNYLPQARVLCASFQQHHPGTPFFTLVIDGSDDDRTIPGVGTVLLPDDLGIPRSEWRAMAAIYSVMELATGLKPAALRAVLRAGTGAAMYLDPDIEVRAALDDVFDAALAHGIVLTPHVLQPMPRDGLTPDEEVIRHAGIFNLGFLAVGPSAMPMLDWWHERLRFDGPVDLAHALFTDQRWMDWVPALFPCTVARDPGLNVAYWNLHERPLRRDEHGQVLAGGAPVRFFHYSGFDPTRPWVLSKHGGVRPRARIGGNDVLRSLTDGYAELLMAAGYGEGGAPYAFDVSADGYRLIPEVRGALRTRVMAGEPALDPFDPDDAPRFRDWLDARSFGPVATGFTAWEYHLYGTRIDLQIAFPDVLGLHAAAYRRWLDLEPSAPAFRAEIGLPPAPTVSGATPASGRDAFGWNVVAYHQSEHGVGEAGRRMSHAIEAAGLPCRRVAVQARGARHLHPQGDEVADVLRFRDTVYCINADELPRVTAVLEHHAAQRGDARRYGLWFWEVDVFPDTFLRSFDLLDEVWVTSEHTQAAIEAVAPVPVRLVPLPVVAPTRSSPFTRRLLGLPEQFLFAFSFDFNSIQERKNPLGTIAAYLQAFGPDDGAHLLLKSTGGDRFPAQYDQITRAFGNRRDITIIDEYWTADQMQGLLEAADCFVSLHRCEGFGLNLATAMAAGTPVIATGYSGNMTFMSAESAFLVPYELVEIGKGHGPYSATARWADPDVAAAAEHMRTVFDRPDTAAERAAAGRCHVLERQSMQRTVAALRGPLLHLPHEATP